MGTKCSFWTLPVGQRLTLVNLVLLPECQGGFRPAALGSMWCGMPSSDSMQQKSQIIHVGRFLRACAANTILLIQPCGNALFDIA